MASDPVGRLGYAILAVAQRLTDITVYSTVAVAIDSNSSSRVDYNRSPNCCLAD